MQVDRRKFIGGSDIAAILGISPWATPLDVYLEKTGECEREINFEQQKRLDRGKRMEPYVIDILEEETGICVTRRNQRYSLPEYPYMSCEIDAESRCGLNIEIKTTSEFNKKSWGEEGTDDIPVFYTAQAMWGLMITGKQECVVAVLIGSDNFKTYYIKRDEEVIKHLFEKAKAFWEMVEAKTPPPPVNEKDIAALFPKDDGKHIECGDDIYNLYQQAKNIREEIRMLELAKDNLDTQIKAYMKDKSTLIYRGNTVATYRTQHTRRFNLEDFKNDNPYLFNDYTKTTESRVLRIK